MSDTTMATLPEQSELRSRLRAARTLQGVTLKDLAARLDPSWKLSERTLRKLENGESDITERALRPIAEALEVPYQWLIAPDPFGPWRVASPEAQAEFERRLSALEARIERERLAPDPRPTPRGRATSK
jgi:transcriptional regulator with XRE-family HTH domain